MRRADIVREALEWQGTRWQHQQSLKYIACDCAGFIRGVHKNLTGIEVPIKADYPATWHLFKQEERCYNVASEYLNEIDIEDIKAGDVILFAYRPRFVAHHMGIYLGQNKFIHADQDCKLVHISPLDKVWKSRIKFAFRFRELED